MLISLKVKNNCENQRKSRASRPKVRSGCVVCKSRHKKCDEQRPSCVMCINSGRKCEYRETPDRRTRAARTLALCNAHFDGIGAGHDKSFSFPEPKAPLVQGGQINLTSEERWFLNYFQKVTSVQCSSYFYDEFWERLVHQASDARPAVRHAAIGMGALNWQFSQLRMGTNKGPLDRRFSLQQCNRAIAHLREDLDDAKQMDRSQVETALVTCLVLVCVILFQEDAETAGRHLKAGENLLKEYLIDNPCTTSISEALKQTFAATDLVYMTIASKSPSKEEITSPWFVPEKPPTNFNNIEKSHDFLLTLSRMVIQSHPRGFKVVCSDPDLDLEPFAVMIKLRGWKAQLRGTLAIHKSQMNQRDVDALTLLEIWGEVLSILIMVDTPSAQPETRYDSLLGGFQKIVDLTEELLRSTKQSKPTFPVETGVVPALFFCAFKCRDLMVRQKAVVLLQLWQCKEAEYSSSPMVMVLQRIIEVECQGRTLDDLVPESCRVESINVDILQDQQGLHLWYRMSRYSEENEQMGQPWQSEFIFYKTDSDKPKITENLGRPFHCEALEQ